MKMVLAISGKRKSGKDFCTKKILNELHSRNIDSDSVGISHSLKMEYARIHNLDYKELLTDGSYKEEHRMNMIKWGEGHRERDPGIFCRAAVESSSNPEILLISDCRRPTDLEFFKSNYSTITLRIIADLETREKRGFQFVKGIDDCSSECALDNYAFEFYIQNDTEDTVDRQIFELVNIIEEKLLQK